MASEDSTHLLRVLNGLLSHKLLLWFPADYPFSLDNSLLFYFSFYPPNLSRLQVSCLRDFRNFPHIVMSSPKGLPLDRQLLTTVYLSLPFLACHNFFLAIPYRLVNPLEHSSPPISLLTFTLYTVVPFITKSSQSCWHY